MLGIPTQTPPAELFTKPTWTTWARYKTEVSQEVVMQFADEIIQNGYPYGVLEIDDRWQTHYGDIAFDPERFPNPKEMIAALHEKGFKVTAWVIPFFDPDAAAFAEGAVQKLSCPPAKWRALSRALVAGRRRSAGRDQPVGAESGFSKASAGFRSRAVSMATNLTRGKPVFCLPMPLHTHPSIPMNIQIYMSISSVSISA